MKKSRLLLVLVLLMSVGCGKVDLADETSNTKPSPEEKPIPPEDINTCLTIEELASVEDNVVVAVGGYIVGYVSGSSITKTVFSTDNAVETNIVLADHPDETDYHYCSAMQLKKGTEARADLNLADNPENLGQFVVLIGTKNKYYYAPGLKPVIDYLFADKTEGEDEEKPQPEPLPKPQIYPILSKQPPRVFEGR